MTIQERIAAAKRSQSGLARVGGQRGENRLPTISQRLDAAKSTGVRLGGVSMMPGAVSAITPTAGGAGGEVMSTGKFGRGGPQIRAVGAEELQLPAVRRKSVLTLPAFYRMDNSPGEPLASPQEVQNVQARMKGLWRPSDALRDSLEDKSARRDELERRRSILQRAQGRYEGAWLDKVDMKPGESAADALKGVEAELAETDRELAGQHWNYYAADNEEQLARLARQPESGTLYEQAGTAGAPDVVIGRVLSALQNGGAPEGDGAAVAQIRERFGVSPEKSGSTAQYMNDLTALLGTDLETRDVQTEAIGELKRRGYNYSRISGYERTRKEAEEYARKMEERQEAAREHPVLSSAASVLASPLQGLDFLDTALRSMGPNSDEKDLSSYVPLDPYAMEATNLVRTLRGTVAEEIEKNTGWEIAGQNAASFLYQTGMSVADSAAQIAAFGPAATYFMGASAASNQAQDIMARGGTNRQVLLGGLAAGAAEAVFEKFSIDHLLSARTVGGAKDLLRETLKQAGVEASEETFTEIANILSDAAIMGGSSGFNLAVRDYETQGMGREEARRRAYLDLVGQVAWAGAGGALSGGVMGGAVRGKQYLGGRLGGVELMPGAADTQREGRQKTASTGEAAEYRAERPQNVELPTVPVINLSMQTVADMNGGVMPKAGNYIRKAALEKTEARLGLDKNPAAYIEASNVTRNGDAYVIKITKSSLNKMLSASSYPERVVPLESIAVLSQLERIAQNGVYFSSEGDRRGRAQIAGYDHLMTTVYIDGVPYLVDMRVRVEDEKAGGGNRLYHFTPETIEVTKKNDGAASTAGRHATSVRSTDTAPSSDPTITQDGPGVKGKDARMAGAVFLPGAADTQREGRQKTASMGEAVGYTPMEADAIRYEGKTFRNIIAGIDSSVSAFFDKWRSGRKGKPDAKLEKLYLGKMDGETAAKVGDILGYEIGARDFIVTNDGVKHIMDTHGDAEGEIRKGNAPLTAAIIDALPDVVAHPDVVRPGNIEKSSPYRQGVIFEKMLPDGTAVYIQFDNSGRGTFEGRTLYVKEKESSSSGVNISEETHTSTSKTTEPELSSGTIIPQEGQGVKGKDAQMAGAVFLPGTADTQREGRQKTASTGEAGTYRAATPQNVELPSVPVINLSLDEVAQLNGGTLPQDGGHIRDTVIERARERLGLDRHSAAFIPASNVFRNGEEYVLKITKATLNKMFSVADGGPVPIESAAIMEHLERIANNGVYFKSEGDRKGRPQINGIDHLMTTVYIDGTPTLVDMRVRLVQQEKAGPTENVLYYFSPETITLTPKKGDGNTPAAERQAFRGEASPSPMDTIPRAGPGVKGKDARMVGAVFLPGSGLDAGDMGSYNGIKEAVGYGREEGAAELRGVYGSDVRGEAQGVDAGGEGPYQETGGGISEKRPAADWSKGHIVEQPLNQASVRAGERASSYIPDVYTVEDAALKKRSPGALAITSDGVIHLSDAIPEPLADAIGYHEVVHAVKQRGSAEYHAFLEDIGGRINPLSDKADEVLGVILRSRFGGKDLLDLSAGELKTAYDELSAVVWGFHKADPENARVKFAEVFTDFDGYIAELDAIMEGARGAYAEGGRTPPGGEGAALDAGERRALEEGWRDEEPGVRAAGPYNGAKEAVSYGRGEEALTGLQGVPGADVRGGNPGADAGGAGGSKTVSGTVSETVRGAKSVPKWAEGHVVEKASNPGTVRAQEAARSFIDGVVVVSDTALKGQHEGAWALTSGGTVLLSDKIPPELAEPVGYHEVVHAVRQRGSEVYRAFLSRLDDRVNFSADQAVFVLDTVVKSRFAGKDLLELNDVELKTVYDELNALVWGYYKADPEHARAEFGGVFTDYDGYIAELDAIMEGARGAYAEGGRTPPGGEGAALDAGERRALEEGWRDEEPGGEGAALDAGEQRALEEGWRDEEPGVRAAGRQKTASTGETAKPRLSMADFTDVNSPVWNNVKYGDTAAQSDITRRVHQEMVDEGAVVRVPDGTLEQVGQSYPDLRSMKKTERTPILRQKMTELKTALRSFLGGLKGGSFEFEVNGNILEAKLYDTGVREVMEKVSREKASMLFHSDEVFQNARYLYSTPDYDGDPNIYRWNYFYTPVQIGDEVVGVRIAVRDINSPRSYGYVPESQIYNWNIKKDTALDGGSSSTRPPSPGVSSAASSDTALDGGGRGQSRGSSGVSSAASSDTALDGGSRGPKVASPGVSSAVSVDAPLDGGGGGQGRKSLGVSSGVSSDTIIPQAGQGVKGKDARMVGAVFLPGRPPDPTTEKRGLRAMEEEKKEPLTLEYFMEQMYGVKVEKKAYTPEEMERYRTRLREYAQEKAAQRAEKQSKDGQRDT